MKRSVCVQGRGGAARGTGFESEPAPKRRTYGRRTTARVCDSVCLFKPIIDLAVSPSLPMSFVYPLVRVYRNLSNGV